MNLVRRDGATVIESAGLAGTASDPSIVQLSGGNLVAVWSEQTNQPTDVSTDVDGAIFARILDGTGQPVSDTFQANNWEPFVQDGPQIIAFANGGFGIGWTNRAVFGDGETDNDVFLNLFNADGERTVEDPIDVVPDNPGPQVINTELTDISFYSFGQYGVSLSDGSTILYDVSSRFVALVTYKPAPGSDVAAGPGDTVQLVDTNIVSAVPSKIVEPDPDDANIKDDLVSIVLSNSRFDGPDGIPGVIDDLIFASKGADFEEIEEVRLASLNGGGFALSYRESVDINDFDATVDESSVLRLEFYTSYGQRVAESVTPLGLTLDDDRGGHDLISLAGGGVAVAIVSDPGDGTGTDVEVLLFDEDGTEVGREQAAAGVDLDQAKPDLEELADGRIALTFTETPGREVGGETGSLHLTFFGVEGESANVDATSEADALAGLSGGDLIEGLAGNDTIEGRDGNDSLYGGAGDDEISGGNGRDGLRGGAGDDTLSGGANADGLNGGAGSDSVNGSAGNDLMGGGAGADRVNGGRGDDVARGGADNDRVDGNAGADRLHGNAGDDVLNGNAGNDRLTGGTGDDRMSGGSGSDVFVFRQGHGDDRITDFDAANDRLVLSDYSAGDVSLSTSGGNTVLALDGGASIQLDDVTLGLDDITITFG